jgi:uridine kinase
MIETIQGSEEFEQKPHRETERKYLPLFPDRLTQFRDTALPIEQFYLSHPDESFSLRMREICQGQDDFRYEATLKDKGEMTAKGLDRLEVNVDISPATYHMYFDENTTPVIHKLRAEPTKHIAIDFFEDGHIQAEAEHPVAWTAFCDRNSLASSFVEITGDKLANNEFRAHLLYRQQHEGTEALEMKPDFNPDTVARAIWRRQLHSTQTLVTIAGRSGSGKTTAIYGIQASLEQNGIRSVVVSTDDYHRGNTWLEKYNDGNPWTDWDAPIVYDIEALQADIRRLQDGETIVRQKIDFTTVEPAYDGVIEPTPVIIVEGIYAGHNSFDALADLHYELPTPFATCIGRRLLRDIRERPEFADPQKSLRYMLQQAEPAYRAINAED